MKKAEKGIRFIDSRYNQLFRIADGGRIKLEYPDGKSDIKIEAKLDATKADLVAEGISANSTAFLEETRAWAWRPAWWRAA